MNIATTEEYKKALLALRDKSKFRKTKYLDMLRAQYKCKNHTITFTRLAEAVDYKNYNAANLQYGTLGCEIAEILKYELPKRKDGSIMCFWALSSGKDATSKTIDGHYELIMREELKEALEEMKWVK